LFLSLKESIVATLSPERERRRIQLQELLQQEFLSDKQYQDSVTRLITEQLEEMEEGFLHVEREDDRKRIIISILLDCIHNGRDVEGNSLVGKDAAYRIRKQLEGMTTEELEASRRGVSMTSIHKDRSIGDDGPSTKVCFDPGEVKVCFDPGEVTGRVGSIEGLTQLGKGQTDYNFTKPTAEILECFASPMLRDREKLITHHFEEFTSLCPKTGQPDFAEVILEYLPDKLCIETKSLKLYYFAYRNEGAFMEAIVAKMLEDFVKACKPISMSVRAIFAPRGGIETSVHAAYHEGMGEDAAIGMDIREQEAAE